MEKQSSPIISLKQELAITFVFIVILILIIYFWPISSLRIIFGFTYILFIPGYFLMAALFPKSDDLDTPNRIIISFGFSIAIVIFVGLLLNYTKLGVQLEYILLAVTSVILLCSGVAYYRRNKLHPINRYVVRIRFYTPFWLGISNLDRFLSIALIFSFLAASGSILYIITNPKNGEKFTEFNIMSNDGVAFGYSRDVVIGKPINVTIGVVNHEQSDVHYRIERSGDTGEYKIADFWLSNGDNWEQPYEFSLKKTGDNQKIIFNLFKDDVKEPYRSLHLWLSVSAR